MLISCKRLKIRVFANPIFTLTCCLNLHSGIDVARLLLIHKMLIDSLDQGLVWGQGWIIIFIIIIKQLATQHVSQK